MALNVAIGGNAPRTDTGLCPYFVLQTTRRAGSIGEDTSEGYRPYVLLTLRQFVIVVRIPEGVF
jgi:hypothetical protein